MTNERAIELLRRLQDEQFDGIHGDERREALEMAVRALEGDGDTISRKMAIDAVKSYWKNEVDRIPKKSTDFDVFTQICDSILTHNANICKVIDKLPSTQPHWIPCSERLPSEGDTVLLYENYAYSIGRLIKTATEEYEWSVNGWYTKIDDWSAWMPLPKPYGGDAK